MKATVEGIVLELGDLQVLPGLINAHDHLEFALFPRLGRGGYANATEWARDIYHPDREPLAAHLRVPKPLRLLWGGLRNLIAGATAVSHHNPYEDTFDASFPVRVVKHYGWAHSLAFGPDVRTCFDATPPDAPFLIHAAEGINEAARQEVIQLERLGVLTGRTVLIHGLALDEAGMQLLRARRAALIWCPRSNLFLFHRTLYPPLDIPLTLGTDSPLTAEGDLLDEICAAQRFAPIERIQAMVTSEAARVLRLAPTNDFIAARAFAQPPELVVVNGRLHLISPSLASQLPAPLRHEFHPLHIDGRPPVLVRWNTPELFSATRQFLEVVRLAGREVFA